MEDDETKGNGMVDLDRRTFFKGGALGLIGAGLTLGGLKALEEDAFGQALATCDLIRVMGKHGMTTRLANFSCLPCDCPGHTEIKHTLYAKLMTAPSCDETQNLIPDGSRLIVNLTRIFRDIGPHGTDVVPLPVGCHKGTFRLQVPNPLGGFITVMSGSMKGVDGMTADHPRYMDPASGVSKYCDQPWHDEGCIDGKAVSTLPAGHPLLGCTLHGTYVSYLPEARYTIKDLCVPDPWLKWQIHLTVCLRCPCHTPQ